MANADNTVQAKRPDGEVFTITRKAFDGVYRYKGWVLVTDAPEPETDAAKSEPTKRRTRRKANT